jgi:hypothetical protein
MKERGDHDRRLDLYKRAVMRCSDVQLRRRVANEPQVFKLAIEGLIARRAASHKSQRDNGQSA